MDPIFWLLLAFVVKHLICDYFLQYPYQYRNKGTYGHPGGILHAGIHAVGTALVLNFWPFLWYKIFILSLLDGVIHYHVDWLKVYVCKRYNWLPNNSDAYWTVLGLDQYLHYLTYFGIVYYLMV